VLTLTTIEVSVIVAMMLHDENNPTLARESVFPPSRSFAAAWSVSA
jgi:Ca2+/H+ antiporter